MWQDKSVMKHLFDKAQMKEVLYKVAQNTWRSDQDSMSDELPRNIFQIQNAQSLFKANQIPAGVFVLIPALVLDAMEKEDISSEN